MLDAEGPTSGVFAPLGASAAMEATTQNMVKVWRDVLVCNKLDCRPTEVSKKYCHLRPTEIGPKHVEHSAKHNYFLIGCLKVAF